MVAASETVTFTGTDAELTLDSPSPFHGAVSNPGGRGTDMLNLLGFGTGTTYTFTPDGLYTGVTLSVKDGARQSAQIALIGRFAATGFSAAISAGHTVFTYSATHTTEPHLGPGA